MTHVVALNGQTWIICGGRDFADSAMFSDVMGQLLVARGCPSKIVHGGARGADEMAADYGAQLSVTTIAVLPDWQRGKMAGPMRNQKMLSEYRPDLVVAFPGGRGTADMVGRARKAGVDVAEVQINS